MNRRGAEVGRNGGNVGPLVACLVDEVCIGDVGEGRVAGPDQDEVTVEEIVHRTGEDDLARRDSRTGHVVAHLGGVLEDRVVEQIRAARQTEAVATIAR